MSHRAGSTRFQAQASTGLLVALLLGGCSEEVGWQESLLAPSLARGGAGRPTVLVNPHAQGNGAVATIQEAIDLVAPDGRVLVLPGTYGEALRIDKGLTIESIGGASGAVVIDPPTAAVPAINVATSAAVTLLGLTVHVPGGIGVIGDGAVNLTIERSVILAIDPQPIPSVLLAVFNDAPVSGRASLVVRNSTIDGAATPPIGQSFAIRASGDVDAVLTSNILRRVGGACIVLSTRNDLGGEMNVDILGNSLDDCQPLGRVAAIIVGPLPANLPSATRPLTATGVVNIIGNTIRNSSASCLTGSAIVYESYTGRIERNRIDSVVQSCATATPRNLPSAIWIGAIRPGGAGAFFPPVAVTVRFNDIAGNAHAGLRIAPNQTTVIDASCNYWGATDGPAGIGPGSGDRIIVEAGGATPLFAPFAIAPIASGSATGC